MRGNRFILVVIFLTVTDYPLFGSVLASLALYLIADLCDWTHDRITRKASQ